ncbi:MAG: glucosaminidase domain-containing protein [Bacteroidota bacterium]|nr:glucosaminidase domain-containing protein [Bacteroidota bacterium]
MIRKIVFLTVMALVVVVNFSCKNSQSEIVSGSDSLSGEVVTIIDATDEISDGTLPDFSSVEAGTQRKEKFFAFMRPMIEVENEKVLQNRNFILKCYSFFNEGKEIDAESSIRLKNIAHQYKLKKTVFSSETDYKNILLRVDVVPVDLALVQAANESAWGTSYFATKGNNIFGQWCFRKGCGMVPRNRPEGESHEVAVFNSVNESIAAYIHNLNTHNAYSYFRNLRYEYHIEKKPVDANKLAIGLQKYSGIGIKYVETLRIMLRNNKGIL